MSARFFFSAGIPIVCGGLQGTTPSDKCFRYDFNKDSWTQSGIIPIVTFHPGYDYSQSWGLGMVYTMHIHLIDAKKNTTWNRLRQLPA
jgi:hypothetical protein